MRRVVRLALVGLAGPLVAQPQSMTVRETVVVTVSLADETDVDAPATVRVVDRETIAARQATEVVDLLAGMPGVTAVQLGGPGQQASVFLRGTESDQSLVLWNGIPLNNPYFGGFNWAFLPTAGVDRIEIAPGPFSALYGSGAAAGVVQIITRPQPGGAATVEGADDGSWRATATAAGSSAELGWEVAAHLVRGESELENDFYDGGELSARLAWRPESGDLALVTRVNDSETGIPFVGRDPSPQRRVAWSEWEWAVPGNLLGDGWALEGLLSQVRYESDFVDPTDPFGFTASHTESRADRARLAATFEISPSLETSVGSDWERLEVSDDSSFGTNLDAANQHTLSLFGEMRYRAARWTTTVGLRQEDNDVYGGHTSPRVGLAVSIRPRLTIRASYGEGFRAPSLGELFFPFSGNPDLEPEENASWELGLRWRSLRWDLDVAIFENRLTNLIDFDFATFTNVNIGRARSRGAEGELSYRTGRSRSRIAVTHLDSEDLASGLPLLRRPQWSTAFEVTFHPGEWTTNVLLLDVGSRPDIDPVTFERTTNPGYTRLDIAARWSGWGAVEPHARIENATDERYEPALGFPAPGRRFVAGLALTR